MIIATLASLKIVSALAKDMVNWELAKRVIPNLYYAGELLVHNAEAAIAKHRQLAQTNNAQQPEPTSTEYLVHNKLEALFAWIQVIVLWHDPYNSLIAISGLFTSFLLLTYFAPNFYATIMIALFVYNLTKLWFRHIWPEIRVPPGPEREAEARLDVDRWTYLHPDLMTFNEFSQIIKNLIKTSECSLSQLLSLRREKPIKFCIIVTSILSCTAFIGNRVSDLSLLFSLTTALILAPGIYLYALPASIKELLGKFINTRSGVEIVDLNKEKKSCEEKIAGGQEANSDKSQGPSQSSSSNPDLSSDSCGSLGVAEIQEEKNLIHLDDEINDQQQRPGQVRSLAEEDDDDGFVIL